MVDGSTVVSDTFMKIHDVLNSNVTTATVSGNTVSLNDFNGKHWLGAFPNSKIDDKSTYPVGIIESPTFEESRSTYTGNTDSLTVDIIVYANRAEAAAKFAEKAWNEIKNKSDSLQGEGLNELETGVTSTNTFVRGDLTVHEYRIPVLLTFETGA